MWAVVIGGAQICRFCFNHIKDNMSGQCPACRQVYDEKNYKFTPPDPSEIKKASKKKGSKRVRKSDSGGSRKHLQNVRVIQRNLVYAIGLSLSVAREETLKRHDFFGQFGRIHKVVVNRHNLYNANAAQGPTVSAYITYTQPDEAMRAIAATDGSLVDGRPIRASFGTTKYCSYFLRSVQCNNPDCMYLHELGDERDSFSKEDLEKSSEHNLHDSTQAIVNLAKQISLRAALASITKC